jgi:hypothetical protein
MRRTAERGPAARHRWHPPPVGTRVEESGDRRAEDLSDEQGGVHPDARRRERRRQSGRNKFGGERLPQGEHAKPRADTVGRFHLRFARLLGKQDSQERRGDVHDTGRKLREKGGPGRERKRHAHRADEHDDDPSRCPLPRRGSNGGLRRFERFPVTDRAVQVASGSPVVLFMAQNRKSGNRGCPRAPRKSPGPGKHQFL